MSRSGPLLVLATLAVAACTAVRHFEVAPVSFGAPRSMARGEFLLAELNCVACHAASPGVVERLQPKTAPILAEVGARRAPEWIGRFLADPQGTQPGTTMPDLLAPLDASERARAVESLVHFLASRGGPIDPGPHAVSMDSVERGRQLFHTVGCVACHEPFESVGWLAESYWALEAQGVGDQVEDAPASSTPHPGDAGGLPPAEAVPLGDLAAKTTVDALARFLADPLAVRPAGRMPSLGLSSAEARDIAAYLLRDQASGSSFFPGLAYEYFEGNANRVADIAALAPVRGGSVQDLGGLPDHRETHYAFRFTGLLEVPEDGLYSFATTSDDGSTLTLDGRTVVDNDGHHAPARREGSIQLAAGAHMLAVSFFQAGGGAELEVTWSGPGVPEQVLGAPHVTHRSLSYGLPDETPFAVDPERAAEGAVLFDDLGCASCHALDAGTAPAVRTPLAELDLDGGRGCIDLEARRGVPRYALAVEDQDALRATLADLNGLATPLDPATHVLHTLDRFRCFACHSRGGIGGPHPDRREHFRTVEDDDLGDQGRLPPHLEFVGAKLRRPWVEAVLFDGAGQRPYMATRMPQFGRANVGHLPALFEAVDDPGYRETRLPFDGALAEAGRQLVGTDGLGCIQCHTFGDHPSLGVPALDLVTVHERTKPAWFAQLLLDPESVGMASRMPRFWEGGASPVKDVLDGDPARQAEAIWRYLALGDGMMLPAGLVADGEEYEVEIGARPRLVGVFMEGVSPRTVLVGDPEGVHYAFDVENSHLAKAWRGRFFNAEGTWRGRAGQLERPGSMDTIDLTPGIPFARVAAEEPWPAERGRQAGYRPLGRRFDADGRPTFRYAFEGITVEESVVPRNGGFLRRLRLRCDEPPGDLAFRAAAGDVLVGNAAIVVDGHVTLRLHRVPAQLAGNEVRVPVFFTADEAGYGAEIEMEVSW